MAATQTAGSCDPLHFNVILVGGGPVAFLTALNLARSGVRSLVLEREPSINQSPRAVVYLPCVQAELREAGIYDLVKDVSVVNDTITYWHGRGPLEKEALARIDMPDGAKCLNCGQPALTEVIMRSLQSHSASEVRFNQQVTGIDQDEQRVTVRCEDPRNGISTEYVCDYLVGADGAGSSVRKMLDIAFEGFSWPKEDFCATNIRYPFEKYGFTTANFVCDPEHWAVVTTIDNTGLWRCAFGVRPGMRNEQIREELEDHFKNIFPGWPGHGFELVKLNKYKPHQRCASTFRKGRCLLAGDAAHCNNPIGGLGLTTGLLDAGPLGRALAAVVLGRAPDALLDTWAALRREKWLTLTNPFSIENKRLLQQGGWANDPVGIWETDEISKDHGMNAWLESVGPDKEAADKGFFLAMADQASQAKSGAILWDITMDVDWMADYEQEDIVQARVALRPTMSSS